MDFKPPFRCGVFQKSRRGTKLTYVGVKGANVTRHRVRCEVFCYARVSLQQSFVGDNVISNWALNDPAEFFFFEKSYGLSGLTV